MQTPAGAMEGAKSATPRGPLERLLGLFADVRPGEGLGLLSLFLTLFTLLFCSSLLKPVREILVLSEGGSEVRSYSVAIQAMVLLLVLPVYGRLSQRLDKLVLAYVIFTMLALNLVAFSILNAQGVRIGVVFFVWLGIFGVLAGAHFWALTSELYSKRAGERLFAVVALGASTGAWVGSLVARELTQHLSIADIFLLVTAALLTSLLPLTYAVRHVPESARPDPEQNAAQTPDKPSLLNGFQLIRGSRYLAAMAAFVFFYNWLNSTGEFLLANIAELFYEQELAKGENTSQEAFLGYFYGTFYLYVNVCGFLIQAFLVSRVVKYLGVRVALVITPLIILFGYGLLSVFTVITVFLYFKITENSLDYSLQNTSRQILYLPLSRQEKYEARSVIDTLIWRMGDLIQGLAVFLFLRVLDLAIENFVYLNLVLAAVVLSLAWYLGKRYSAFERRRGDPSSA